MSREIKFRVWSKEGKKLHYVDFNRNILDGFVELHLFHRIKHKLDSIEIMQYTGLKDTNGKEIYEGDIVRSILNGAIAPIIYDGKRGRFRFKDQISVIEDVIFPHNILEVIGNIYENPELLEK